MGVYKKAVITNAGRALMARSIAGEVVMQFSRAVTSSHLYPSETDFKGYISLEGIEQTVIPSNVQVVNDTLISVRNLFGNESISESYLIQNIGLYATDGNEEVLFSVSQATIPDEMPAYNGVAPSSFIYTIQATVSQASSLSMTINPTGAATTQDILDLDGAKLDKSGDVSETVVETLEPIETKFPIPSAGETIKRFLGKIRTFMSNTRPLEANVTYYVATTGSDTTGDGTSGNPFKTIQHAVDVIPSDLGSYTANVIVANGTYDEAVVIQNKHNGTLLVRSNTPTTVSSNVNVIQIRITLCECAVFIQGIAMTLTGNPSFFAANCNNVVGQYLRIIVSDSNPGVNVSACNSFRLSNSEISNRSYAVRFVDSSGYVSACTGTGNSYSIRAEGSSTVHLLGSSPTSVNGHSQTLGGQFVNSNGTQISGIVSSGLSCTWGTMYGGYVRHGNWNGMAQVIIQLRVSLTVALTAGTQYFITGFPVPNLQAFSIVPVPCHDVFNTRLCYLDTIGKLTFVPNNNIASEIVLIFGCTYITNS